MGLCTFDLCSDLVNLRAVRGGLRVAGSGNSRRDFETIGAMAISKPGDFTRIRANCPLKPKMRKAGEV